MTSTKLWPSRCRVPRAVEPSARPRPGADSVRAAFDARLLSVPGLAAGILSSSRRLVEVVADRQGDIGGGGGHAGELTDGRDRDEVPTMSSVIAPAARAAPTAQWWEMARAGAVVATTCAAPSLARVGVFQGVGVQPQDAAGGGEQRGRVDAEFGQPVGQGRYLGRRSGQQLAQLVPQTSAPGCCSRKAATWASRPPCPAAGFGCQPSRPARQAHSAGPGRRPHRRPGRKLAPG